MVKKSKLLGIFVSLALCVGLFPLGAFAGESPGVADIVEESVPAEESEAFTEYDENKEVDLQETSPILDEELALTTFENPTVVPFTTTVTIVGGGILTIMPDGTIDINGITGATLAADTQIQSSGDLTIVLNNDSLVTIEGISVSGNLTITSNVQNNNALQVLGNSGTGIAITNSGSLMVEDGAVVSVINTGGVGVSVPAGGAVDISNGSLAIDLTAGVGIRSFGDFVVGSQGSVTIKNTASQGAFISGTTDIEGVVVTESTNGTGITSVGTLSVLNGGSLEAKNSRAFYGVYSQTSIAVSGQGSTIVATGNASCNICVDGGNLSVRDGASLIASLNQSGHNVWLNGQGDFIAEGSGTAVSIADSAGAGIYLANTSEALGGNVVVTDAVVEINNSATYGLCAPLGLISISGGEVSANQNISNSGLRALGNITISNSADVETSSSGYFGVYSVSGNVEVTGNSTLNAHDNNSRGIVAGNDLLVDSATLVTTGNTNSGIVAGESGSGDVVIRNASSVTSENNGSFGLFATGGSITVSDSIVATNSNERYDGMYSAAGISVSGVSTSIYSSGNGRHGIHSAANDITINDGSMYGSTDASDAYGVFAETGNIVAQDALIEGSAEYFGVRARGNVSASGENASITGIVKYRGTISGNTAAVFSDAGTISAQNGSIVEEIYTETPVSFNDLTPIYPYTGGSNVYSIQNYIWSPNLAVSGDGLLVTDGLTQSPTQDTVVGVRTGASTNEDVVLDASSTHKISFDGTLARSSFMITYIPNGGTGDILQESYYYKNIAIISSNVFTAPEDMKFVGWGIESDATEASYQPGEKITMDNSNLTLYALWESEASKNGGSVAESIDSASESGLSSVGYLAKAGDQNNTALPFALAMMSLAMLTLSFLRQAKRKQ